MLDHSANISRHALADRKDDLYETPPEATRALLKAEKLPHGIWECACGRGAISKILVEAGHAVCASDLVAYGAGYAGIDFLMEHKMPLQTEAIITESALQARRRVRAPCPDAMSEGGHAAALGVPRRHRAQ
jgi:hypothetical protein